MDTITKSIFSEFVERFEYKKLSESDAFERFATYCVVAQHLKNDTITKELLECMHTGKDGNDWGIDGFAIIVNGRYVSNIKEIENLLEVNGEMSVEMFAVQAKLSTSIDCALLGQSLDGVQFILEEVNSEKGTLSLPPSNEEIGQIRELVQFIYSKCAKFKNGINPDFHLFYVYCGGFQEGNLDREAKYAKTNNTIKQLQLIEGDLHMEYVDKNLLKQYYDATKRRNQVTIKVEHKLNMPDVDKITESYLCIIPFGEIEKMLVDDDNKINLSIFEDNVRAFQGENTVNKAIAESLKSGELDLFTAMNNGITVIAKEVSTTGQNIKISDYQIVNGCQTCHILFANRNLANIKNLKLIVKIISSQDKEIKDKIIVGNNSQTEVKREQLISLLDTQRTIEAYYNAQKDYEKLYYERRSKQYKNDPKIRQTQIVTISFQIKSFVSMIMGQPDQVNGYYGSIIEQFDKNGQKVFRQDTDPALYYTSALAGIKLEQMFNDGILPTCFKRVKFHLLYAFRLIVEKEPLPPQLNNRKISNYCAHICAVLCDKKKCQNAFEKSYNIIEKTLGRRPNDKDPQDASLTQKIKDYINAIK